MLQKKITTIGGNAQISTAQSVFGGASLLLDGTGDFVQGDFATEPIGSGDFTVEYRVRHTGSFYNYITHFSTPRSTTGFNLGTQASAQLVFYVNTLGEVLRGTGTNFVLNTWHHVAVVRNSGTIKGYVDGVEKASASNSTNFSQTSFSIGSIDGAGGEYTTGNIDEVRVSNVARYTAGFTPPTEQFNTDANTLLLMHFNQYFVDESVNRTLGEYLGAGSAITKGLYHLNGSSGDSSGNSNNGTDTAITYSQANGKFGQGAGFNGSTSYIATPNNAIGTGQFSISTWVKLNDTSSQQFLISAQTSGGISMGLYLDGYKFYFGRALVNFDFVTNDPVWVANTWYNIVVTRDGSNNLRAYVNSSQIGATTSVTSNYATSTLNIGRENTGKYFNGAIDEIIIENRAWTASEIKKYYTMSKGRFGIL